MDLSKSDYFSSEDSFWNIKDKLKSLSEKYSITSFKPEFANKPWQKLSSTEKLMSLEPNKELLLQELKER